MNNVVLVTGVSSGIGKATAKLFAQNGWRVIGVARGKTNDLDFVHHYICGDVSKVEDVDRIFHEIRNEEGFITSLVNNAGTQICKPITETDIEEWDLVLNTNLRAAYLFIKNSFPLMREKDGSIINVSSVHAIATSKNISSYAASKGALVSLTRAVAIELAPNIRVNAVLPGAVETPMLYEGFMRGHLTCKDIHSQIEEISRRTVIGRVGIPREIAQMILFLADETRSSFITGQAFIVDGGATARLSTE